MEKGKRVILERELKLLIEYSQSNAYVYYSAIRILEGILYRSQDNQIKAMVMGILKKVKSNGNPVDIRTKRIINRLHHDYIVEQLIKVEELVLVSTSLKNRGR